MQRVREREREMDSYTHSSSSGRRSRMLEVTIISANLITKSRGQFYVKLWIVDHQNYSMLKTKKVCSYSTGSGSKPIWNQKFVFAIPHTFVVDNKVSSVWFEVFRVRKGFPDKSLGKAEGKLQLEKTSNEEKTNDEGNDDNEVIYDSEIENEYFCTDEESDNGEEEKEEVDSCELKGTGRVGVGGGGGGELNVEMALQKGFLSRVGQCKWRGWAMEYDEFMGTSTTCIKKKKKKSSHFLMCFSKTITKD